jgi:hypothetical protein
MKISIAEPCHENWDAMTPNKQGAFCHSCVKDVVDFSNKSLEEIKNFFSKPQTGKVCGRFEEKQLQELSFDDFFSRFTYWNFTKKFAAIFFMSFGFWIFSNSTAMGQSDRHMMKGEIMVAPAKTTPVEAQKRMIKGKIARNVTTCTSETVTPERTVKGNAIAEPTKPVEEKYMMMGMVAYKPHVDKKPEVTKTETKITGDTTIVNQPLITEPICKSEQKVIEEITNVKTNIDTAEIKVAKTTLTEKPISETKILVYPNPNNGYFTIETSTKQTVYVFDEHGKIVLTQAIDGTTNIDASQLRAGMYSVNLLSSEGRITNSVIITK